MRPYPPREDRKRERKMDHGEIGTQEVTKTERYNTLKLKLRLANRKHTQPREEMLNQKNKPPREKIPDEERGRKCRLFCAASRAAVVIVSPP